MNFCLKSAISVERNKQCAMMNDGGREDHSSQPKVDLFAAEHVAMNVGADLENKRTARALNDTT